MKSMIGLSFLTNNFNYGKSESTFQFLNDKSIIWKK